MLPGESPLAFFLRTKATDTTKEVAKEVETVEASKKDAYWERDKASSRVDTLLDGVSVAPIEGKGRGLVTRDAIAVGTVVLRERAVAAVRSDVKDVDMPIRSAVRLAIALLVAGREADTRTLTPRMGREFAEHPVGRARAEELAQGRAMLQKACTKATAAMDDEALERLLLVNTLNTNTVRLPDGSAHEGLFAEVGAMVNHCCAPNLLFHGVGIAGEDKGHDQLQLVAQAVRNIEAGEELTISYLGDLYLPFAERDERLQDLYAFAGSRLPTDPGLEALSASALAKDKSDRDHGLQRVVAANTAAHDAWERAAELRAAGAEHAGDMRKQQATAAAHYAALLNTNLLAETHAWRYNATWRLASLLMADAPPKKACIQALMLWESAMRSGLRVWPSEHWPEHRMLLRAAQQAASGASDEAKSEEYLRRLGEIEEQMRYSA